MLPYQRPPLSKKYLLGQMDAEQLLLRPQAFYEENEITLLTNAKATQIDRSGQTVRVGGENIAYNKLALTTGSRAVRLPAAQGGELENVYTVRTLADIDRMNHQFVEGRRLLVVGGGYIGLEAAAVAAARGLKVTLIEKSERILQRVAAKQTSDFFRQLHQGHGVKILEGVGVETLEGDEKVQSAILEDGSTLEVDFAIIGIGIRPEVTLADEAGLQIENGIWTDENGRTSDPTIWAAGDCASFEYRGERIRLESVPHAVEHAECVAQNMLGANKTYVARPWFWSDQYNIKLQIAGLNHGYDSVVTQLGKREGSQSFWYYRKNELLAVDAINDPKAYMTGRKLIESADG